MREILFRGKGSLSNRWEIGNLTIDYGTDYHISSQKITPSKATEPVIKESVGQFIGFSDKNGVKIFENDFVMFDGLLFQVVYVPQKACFSLKGTSRFADIMGNILESSFTELRCNQIEVVGNQTDNPELLSITDELLKSMTIPTAVGLQNQTLASEVGTFEFIDYKEHRYWYEHKVAKNGMICLATKDPKKYCNGVYVYSDKDPGSGLAFVVVNTDNPEIQLQLKNQSK